MKNSIISLGAFFLMTTAYVCGCGVCKANAEEKVVKQSLLISKSSPKKVILKITGMSCAGCANHVSKALKNVNGIIEESVKFPGDVAIVKYDAAKTRPEELIKAIEKAGYKAEVIKPNTKA